MIAAFCAFDSVPWSAAVPKYSLPFALKSASIPEPAEGDGSAVVVEVVGVGVLVVEVTLVAVVVVTDEVVEGAAVDDVSGTLLLVGASVDRVDAVVAVVAEDVISMAEDEEG